MSKFWQQIKQIKKNYKDYIVMFNLGDFYEIFDVDADIISKELQLTKHNRKIGNKSIIMVGFPSFSADKYIKQLVQKGYSIAICEPIIGSSIDGVIPRQVTKVINK